MSDRDLPQGTADDGALSFSDGVSAIETLFDPADPDLDQDNEGNEEAADENVDDGSDEGADVDDESAEIDDEADTEAEEQEDSPSNAYAKGRFAADDAKVTLDDGTTITVAELKRNNLFQRDYSRKTEELKAERSKVEAERSRVTEQDAALAQQYELISVYAQNFMPQPPDRALMQSDPLGYMERKAAYDEHVQFLNQVFGARQAEVAKAQAAQRAEAEGRLQVELDKTVNALPHLRDPKRWEGFRNEIGRMLLEDYQFTKEELNGLQDHRMMLVLHDAAAWRKLQKQKPKATEDVRGKPKMKMVQKQRVNPQSLKTRDAQTRALALKKSGSFEAGVASLMDLDI